jgi:hypothetical protein
VWEDERIVSLMWRHYTEITANIAHYRIEVKPTEDVKIRAELKYFWAQCGNSGALFTNVSELTVEMRHTHKECLRQNRKYNQPFRTPGICIDCGNCNSAVVK